MKVRIQITVNATFHSQYLQVLNSTTLYDESVDEFLTRHFGIDFAQLFGSALIHGIYAADTRMLSVRATFPVLCRMEEIGRGSLVRGALKQMLPALRPRSKEKAAAPYDVYDLGEVPQLVRSVSVYSFRGGMQTLTQAMAEQLRAQDNVEVLEGDPISAMGRSADGRSFEVSTTSLTERLVNDAFVSLFRLPQSQGGASLLRISSARCPYQVFIASLNTQQPRATPRTLRYHLFLTSLRIPLPQ